MGFNMPFTQVRKMRLRRMELVYSPELIQLVSGVDRPQGQLFLL